MIREQVPRRAPRRPVELAAQCRTHSGLRANGWISDITPEGCCVVTNYFFVTVDARVVIRPDGMEGLMAAVRWIDGNRAGIEFAHPLYPPIVDHLVARHGDGQPLIVAKY